MLTETLQMDMDFFFRILTACFLGCLIGWEREKHRKIVSAGIRTYGAISMGSCAFALIGLYVLHSEPTRVASQVVTGIGFLGAGIIFRQGDYVSGLTTAATLWATAAVGMAAAFGMYMLACLTALLLLLLLYLPRVNWWKRVSKKKAAASKKVSIY